MFNLSIHLSFLLPSRFPSQVHSDAPSLFPFLSLPLSLRLIFWWWAREMVYEGEETLRLRLKPRQMLVSELRLKNVAHMEQSKTVLLPYLHLSGEMN